MLRMDSACKEYHHRRGGVFALNNVSLHIPRGDFVAIVGPSGSGKSTLLLMLGGMLSPSSGKIYLDQESIYDISPDERAARRRAKLGFVFQTFNLVTYLSAMENVQIPLYLSGLDGESQERRAMQLLVRVGLGDRTDHKPSELSIGQQQRVALARVLANDPAVILADEPTGNLDPETGEQVINFLEELNQEGRTIVMVTHDMRAAARATRVLRLAEGAIQADTVANGELNGPAQARSPILSQCA